MNSPSATAAAPHIAPVQQYAVHRLRANALHAAHDCLVVEEPLEMRVNEQTIGVVMRTPGHDFELARGFMLGEGLLPLAEINWHLPALSIDWARDEMGLEIPNVIACTAPGLALDAVLAHRRQMLATSSCGICGRASLERVRVQALPLADSFHCSLATLQQLAPAIGAHQTGFAATGGLHAAALFNSAGEIFLVREDIGRHNAVDKVLGAALLAHAHPLSQFGLWVSGRLSFEMAQKALLGGVAFVAAVSAASALAVELARETNMTLVGFLRAGQAVVYHGAQRLREHRS